MGRKILIVLLLVASAVSMLLYFQPYIASMIGEKENEELIDEYVSDDQEYKDIDMDSLLETNSDLKGWIYIPDLYRFSYPLVASHDNHEYLVTSFEGNESEAGTPFIDIRCSNDLGDFNTLIYGHYTPDGNFFGALYDYYDDDSFESYPELQIYTLNNTVKIYNIVAIEEVNINNTNLFTTGYLSDTHKQEYIDEMLGNSDYDYGIEVTTTDHIVNLVCCTQQVEENKRLIVSYKLVDEVKLS